MQVYIDYQTENGKSIETGFESLTVNPKINLIEQVNIARLKKSKETCKILNCKVYSDCNIIFVSVYMNGSNIPLQNKVALKNNIDSIDDILQVAFDFSEEIRKEMGLSVVWHEIFLEI